MTVPQSAKPLLAFLSKTETGKTGDEAYRTIYGHRESRLTKPVTEFTLDELLAAQKTWGKNWGSSAAGAYQIIRKTLVGLMKELELPGSTRFTPTVQDSMGYHLLKRRGFERFVAGKLPLKDFGLELAKEWASMPVLAKTQGASRIVERGQSYYAGDGLNKSLVKPGDIEWVLSDILNRADTPAPEPVQPPKPVPGPTPGPTIEPKPTGFWGLLMAIVAWFLSLFSKGNRK